MAHETFLNGKVQLCCGDSIHFLRDQPDNRYDSIVTDPPYALVSITKRFGANGAAPVKVPEGGSGAYARASAGFMGKKWDTGETAFAIEFWEQCLRVLKPGGHVVAFGGTRTYHRLACAIEDSGFEIRDMLSWLYGSGFPKSHDVSKGIDKAAGIERRVIGNTGRDPNRMIKFKEQDGTPRAPTNEDITAPATLAAQRWEGWGTALKPACEPICFGRKPLIGTIAENVLQHGTGAINIDGCRVESGDNPMTWETPRGGIWLTDSDATAELKRSDKGRWPANIIHDGSDEVLAAFPDGISGGGHGGSNRSHDVFSGGPLGRSDNPQVRGDAGSSARFFYTAKADAGDRLGSKHPTIKPVDLMQWLVRLVTPKGGLVLDPFAGTGTTAEACYREGMRCMLIERETEYQADIRRRMGLMMAGPEERSRESIKAKTKDQPIDAGPLFAATR